MQVKRFTDPAEFLAYFTPALTPTEAEDNIIFGVTNSIIGGRYDDAYMSVIEHDGEIVQVMVRTPPFPLQFSYMTGTPSPDLVQIIVDEWDDAFGATLTGIGGAKVAAAAFAHAWTARHKVEAKREHEMRTYKITQVTPPDGVPGQMRPATWDDLDLLTQWLARFDVDTGMGERPHDETRQAVEYALNTDPHVRALYVWEVDGVPVSMAGSAGPTPRGMRVNAVYTPPEHRKHGYASACVAAVTQHLFDSGREFCFLFTDLANPTSNHIYQQIGYKPVCDVDRWLFQV